MAMLPNPRKGNYIGRASWLQCLYFTLIASVALQAQTQPGPAAGGEKSGSAKTHFTNPALSGKLFQPNFPGSEPISSRITIEADSIPASGMSTFSLQLPSDAISSTLQVVLNGQDVSGRFHGSTTVTLSASDGLSSIKNVLSATVKTSSNSVASGRWRSMNAPVAPKGARPTAVSLARAPRASPSLQAKAVAAAASVCDPVAMCPAWLPPTVRFDTVEKGGWTTDANAWISINGVTYPDSAYTAPGTQYAILSLDRQTLAIENFQATTNSAIVTALLKNFTSNDLVIVGTTAGSQGVDGGLDTSSIGGTNFGTYAAGYPKSYMVIGSGGQTPGTAYENQLSNNAFATGSLVEDVDGNYNFQSSDIIEYAIEPADPGNYGNPTIRMNVPTNLSVLGELQVEFLANATAGQNGLWLLVLDRTSIMPPNSSSTSGCHDVGQIENGTRVMANCGTFYQVGAGNSNIDGEWQNLANALAGVNPNQIVFLQSIGTVGSGSLAQTIESPLYFGNRVFTGFRQFANVFESFGGTPMAVAGPNYSNTDSYGFVGYNGARNALTGNAAEVSTALPGPSGVLHGTLQRGSDGLYRPAQSSPEDQNLFNAKGLNNDGLADSDFTLATASAQQPVPWPSNSPLIALPGATIAGQQAAYRFMSHWLLAAYYMKGIQGPHQDDIHYFFTGSTNTSIDYHVMDPANLPLPNPSGGWAAYGCDTFDGTTCTFQAPGDSAASSFTSSDFNAVKAQMSLEVTYLTNTLQYLVTGSTNLKDVVATGNANTGLALTAAANTVMGSGMANLNAQAIAQKQVTFSWQSLISTLGGIAETLVDIESFGETFPAFSALDAATQLKIKRVASSANSIGAALSTIASGPGIKATTVTQPSAPQPFAQLTTTVGQLATQDLQSPIVVGFDSMADNVTSDWLRLSTIGPRIVNTNDSTFFAPTQETQVTAINALTSSASMNFYFSLLPTVYTLHYWSGVDWSEQAKGFQPTVGSLDGGTNATCHAFYLTPNNNSGQTLGTLAANQGQTYPTMGGVVSPLSQDEGPYDFWTIDGAVARAGTQNTNVAVITPDLADSLFSANQLNVPMMQFFSANGPMASVTKDASVDTFTGWTSDNVCDASDPLYDLDPTGVLSAPPPNGSGGKTLTTTNIVSSTSGVLGHDALFTAQVTAGSQPVSSGSVYISIDGSVIGNPSLGTDGTASVTVPGGLSLGKHQIQADFAPSAGYNVSSASPATFMVYSESADISMSMASTNMNVSYTTASTPVALKISSVAGLSGDVALSCTGLPAGLTCSFNSQSLKLAADGSVNATMQIGPSPSGQNTAAFIILPLFGLGCLVTRRTSLRRLLILIVATGLSAAALTGCAGGSVSNPTPLRETGAKTITVNARVGSVSRSMAVDVNIQ